MFSETVPKIFSRNSDMKSEFMTYMFTTHPKSWARCGNEAWTDKTWGGGAVFHPAFTASEVRRRCKEPPPSTYSYRSSSSSHPLWPTPCPEHQSPPSWRSVAPHGRGLESWPTPTPTLWTAKEPVGKAAGKRGEGGRIWTQYRERNEEEEEVQGNIKQEDTRGREENVENTKTKREARSETLIPSPSPLKANQLSLVHFSAQTYIYISYIYHQKIHFMFSFNFHKRAKLLQQKA